MTTDNELDTRIAELIREAALEGVRDELPHSIAVTVEETRPMDGRPDITAVYATIHLERRSQKGIVIGSGGTRLRDIGTQARVRRSRSCSAGACTSICTSPSRRTGSATRRSWTDSGF